MYELIWLHALLQSRLLFGPRLDTHPARNICIRPPVVNSIFPALICWKGEIGIKDFVALLSGDAALGERDRLAEGKRE